MVAAEAACRAGRDRIAPDLRNVNSVPINNRVQGLFEPCRAKITCREGGGQKGGAPIAGPVITKALNALILPATGSRPAVAWSSPRGAAAARHRRGCRARPAAPWL